jgi:thymidylate synthase (FAD)
MKFVTPEYTIMSSNFTRENVLSTIETAARVCYQSEGKICEGSDVKLLKKLLELGHEAMIEHGPDLQVRLKTCRGVTHEIVRNRLFSFAQESTRYVKYSMPDEVTGLPEPMQFMLPPWIKGDDRDLMLRNEWNFIGEDDEDFTKLTEEDEVFMRLSPTSGEFTYSLATSEMHYANLINAGWQPQQAREVLPNALKTEIIIKGNIRQWRHFFSIRCDKPAHPQMREWTIPLFNELRADIPELWDDIAEKIDLTF